MAHNFYQQRGGEDKCFWAESELLRGNGQELLTYTVHNDAIDQMSGLEAARAAVWNRDSYNELSRLVRSEKPEVVHFHNTFPLMSPAAFWAARSHGCAVVATLHNYRILCPAGTLARDGRVCEDCVGRPVPWPAVAHGCYRDSRAASAAVASSSFAHRILRTWGRKVDTFIALTEFARRKFIEGGLPAGKIHLKPNFVHPDPGPGEASRNYALFVGRISPEKGIDTLLAAWNKLAEGIPLRIVGTGPLSPRVESASSQSDAIEFLDHKSASDVMDLIAGAQFLVVPSIWYETFGLVIVDAFAKAQPVIASRLGAMTELVQDGHTGLLFEPGNPDDLAAKVMWAIGHPAEMRVMGQNARGAYLKNYTAQGNYDRLMEIYGFALASARGGRHRHPA
jgi:glycosyltransferase involved in cell wall biosynthesis